MDILYEYQRNDPDARIIIAPTDLKQRKAAFHRSTLPSAQYQPSQQEKESHQPRAQRIASESSNDFFLSSFDPDRDGDLALNFGPTLFAVMDQSLLVPLPFESSFGAVEDDVFG